MAMKIISCVNTRRTYYSATTPAAISFDNPGVYPGGSAVKYLDVQVPQDGDVLIACIVIGMEASNDMSGGPRTPTAPAGWTLAYRADTTASDSSVDDLSAYVYTKTVNTGSDTSTYTWDFTFGGSPLNFQINGNIWCIRGVSTTTPIAASAHHTEDLSTSVTLPTVSTTALGQMAIGFWAAVDGDALTGNSNTVTVPTNWVDLGDLVGSVESTGKLAFMPFFKGGVDGSADGTVAGAIASLPDTPQTITVSNACSTVGVVLVLGVNIVHIGGPGGSKPSTHTTAKIAVENKLRDALGVDILFTDDFKITARGDYQEVSGKDNLRKSIYRRLWTIPGEYALRPTYGAGLRTYVKKTAGKATKDELRNFVKASLLQDHRITDVPICDVSWISINGKSALQVTVTIISKGEEHRFEPFNFSEVR